MGVGRRVDTHTHMHTDTHRHVRHRHTHTHKHRDAHTCTHMHTHAHTHKRHVWPCRLAPAEAIPQDPAQPPPLHVTVPHPT